MASVSGGEWGKGMCEGEEKSGARERERGGDKGRARAEQG